MRDARAAKVWRELSQHRWRSALVVLALAASLAAAGTVLVTWALVRAATVDGYRASLPVSATFRLGDVADERLHAVLQQVREMPGVASARVRRVVGAAVQGAGPWRNALLVSVEDSPPAALGLLRDLPATWPPAPGTLLIERSSLDFSQATLGEDVQVKGASASEPVSAAVAGTVRDVGLAPGWMENLVVAYATRATLASLGLGAQANELQIRANDSAPTRAAVRALAGRIAQTLQREGVQLLSLDVPEPGQHVHARQMNSLLMTQAAFGVLALAVSALLVVNLMAALLARQGRQIAVMKVLGARPRDLMAMHLALAAALGMAAAAIALPLAAWAGRRYAAMKGELLNFPVDSVPLPSWCLLSLAAVAVLLPMAAAVPQVRRASRSSVAEGLRDIGIVSAQAPLATRRVLGVQHWPRPLALALGNALRRRQRLVLTLLALAAGGAVLVGAGNLRRAVQGSVEQLFATQRWQLTLRLTQPHAAAPALAAARAVPGVTGAEAWRGKRAKRPGADGLALETVNLVGVDLPSALLAPTVLAGRWLQVGEEQALVLSRSYALEHPELQPGGELVLLTDGHSRRWPIVGIVDSGPQPLAYVPRSALNPAGADEASTLIVALQASTPAGQLDAALRLRSALGEAGIPIAGSQLQAENRRVVEDHLLMVVDFLGVMGWVMLAVGGLALASTMGLAVLERQREIGVLRAIGASQRAVMGLVLAEGGMVTLTAWLASLPLAAPISLVLGEAFGRVMFRVPVQPWPEPGAALLWLAVMLAVALLACAAPAWRAMRVPTARALAYAG